MDAKELMIGDWVSHNGIRNRIAPADLIPDAHKKWLEESQPIPITSEILEKLGFIATHHPGTGATEETTEYTLDRLCVIHNTDDWRHECFYVRGLPCYELKWFHQLRHLMIGCGIEKDIVL